jgi:hypothetical protein
MLRHDAVRSMTAIDLDQRVSLGAVTFCPYRRNVMPTEAIILSACIVAMFAAFGAAVYYGDRQTRSLGDRSTSQHRRS